MGGPGSGRRINWKRTPTVRDRLRLSATEWRRHGVITPGERRIGEWRWLRSAIGLPAAAVEATERHRGALSYETECGETEGAARLRYIACDPRTGAVVRCDETIALTSIPANIRRGRTWHFRCPAPGCGARVRHLYLHFPDGRFVCRRCAGLTYESCQTSHMPERLARKLAPKLGEDARDVEEALRTMDAQTLRLFTLALR